MKKLSFRNDSVIEDPDSEKVPNLVIQFKKSIDTGGDKPIVFMDGTHVDVSVTMMIDFLNIYDSLKPIDREEMQNIAVHSIDALKDVLVNFHRPKAPKSNYI